MTSRELVCCCNRPSCSCSVQVHSLIEALECDVYEAGLLGQQLLERYESHILASETERKKLMDAMELLEKDKAVLEKSNARIINENRAILDHLEHLNQEMVSSDSHATAISRTLDSTRQELQRLSSLAQRATFLEAELAALESERENLHSEIATCQDEKHFVTQRWKRAESIVESLQEQIDRMELEACAERQKYSETVWHFKQQIRQKDNRTASGIVFADKLPNVDGPEAGSLSHFVRDVLQDNSNLQLGIQELKELLVASHSEIKSLRSQLDIHRGSEENSSLRSHSLQAEIRSTALSDPEPNCLPEQRTYHHCHDKKRDGSRFPGQMAPSSLHGHLVKDLSFSSSESLLQDRVSRKTITETSGWRARSGLRDHSAKWSVSSNITISSCPSVFSNSPQKIPSIFDPLETVLDSGTTTPANSLPGSPVSAVLTHKPQAVSSRIENAMNTKLSEPSCIQNYTTHDSAYQLNKSELRIELERYSETRSPTNQADGHSIGVSLHRTRSHESILTSPGTNTHSSDHWNNLARARFNKLAAPVHSVCGPAASTAALTATNAFSVFRSSRLDGNQKLTRMLENGGLSDRQDNEPFSVKKVGHWVLGKKIAVTSPMATKCDTNSGLDKDHLMDGGNFKTMHRAAGVNQFGPIYGIYKPQSAPIRVQPDDVDSALLKETLQDG